MKLFKFTTSCFSAKVAKCLDLKAIPYTSFEIPYFDRQDIVRMTGDVKAPVLVDGDRVLTESSRITAWLDETFAPSLRPAHLAAAAVVYEQWADAVLEDAVFRFAAPELGGVVAARNGGRIDAAAHFRFTKERKYGAGCLEAWSREAADLAARIRALLLPLEATLRDGAHLLGHDATLADAAVWGNLTPLALGRPGWLEQELPNIARWFARTTAVCTDTAGPWV